MPCAGRSWRSRPAKAAERAVRAALRRLHGWAGLGLGLWLILAGLSGAVLVFWHEIESLSQPVPAASAGAAQDLGVLLRVAARALPEAEPWRVFPPDAPGATFRLMLLPEEGPPVTVHVDPANAAVLAVVPRGSLWIHWLYDLHDGRLLGEAGSVAVGLIGLVLAAMVVAGVVLWLRRDGRPLAESLLAQKGLRGLRRARNQHRAMAARAAIPLFVTGLTGAALVFPEQARSLLGAILPAGPAALERPGTGRPIDLATAVLVAEAALPGYRTAWVDLPVEKGDTWEVALLATSGGVRAPARATIDWDGAIAAAAPPTPVETARAWIMALHNGQAGGWLLRGLVVILGLMPAVLAVTGASIWWRRRAPRRVAARTAAP